MTRFLIRRLAQGLITFFLVINAVYFFIQLLMPGDFVGNFYMMDAAQKEAMREALGLNLPVWQQYATYMLDLIQLDLGQSYWGPPVVSIVERTLVNTLIVFVPGMVLAFIIGQWVGQQAAWRGRGPLTGTSMFTVILLYAFFPPALAHILRVIFARHLGLFPWSFTAFADQFETRFGMEPFAFAPTLAETILIAGGVTFAISLFVTQVLKWRISLLVYLPLMIGALVGTWATMGIAGPAYQLMLWAAIPLIAFTLLSTGEIAVITRTSVEGTLTEQYIETARAKGIPERLILRRHAVRNAILPILSKLVVSLPYLLAGLVIIERAVNWPGIGTQLFVSVDDQDLHVAMAMLMLIALVTLVARIFLEIAYATLDPRIRRSS